MCHARLVLQLQHELSRGVQLPGHRVWRRQRREHHAGGRQGYGRVRHHSGVVRVRPRVHGHAVRHTAAGSPHWQWTAVVGAGAGLVRRWLGVRLTRAANCNAVVLLFLLFDGCYSDTHDRPDDFQTHTHAINKETIQRPKSRSKNVFDPQNVRCVRCLQQRHGQQRDAGRGDERRGLEQLHRARHVGAGRRDAGGL